MNKIPFGLVSIQVEKLFSKEFAEDDVASIVEHCDMIRNYIELCGWSVEDYTRQMMRNGKEEELLN